ncbi:fructosamine kinase family protein [Cellulomonas sp.]|uniref:fructosamine kinase family protein n=1 Tax=Cellulomonas sp. TaxID=40001 RepID=UPI001B2D4443|nr:fructosamine kinase family protein [Cellulomonas sp.]MBO9554937.1 fructosamine kinase family protein [Cellulomonas sp.]
MSTPDLLLRRLHDAGLTDVTRVEEVHGGVVHAAGLAHRPAAAPLFVKTPPQPCDADIFDAEADGLRALRELGGVRTPDVHLVTPDLLVLEALQPRTDTPEFWERLAHDVAHLHTSTQGGRFGWHRTTWLGLEPQDNTWEDDGFEFFARRRLLRWLPEPRVQAAFDESDRKALERLCDLLPELLPERPSCLTHGDLWSSNVIATADGTPALVDPAVSRTWGEVDVAMLWSEPRPPESDRFFDVYAEVMGLDDGWRDRMPLLYLRQNLAVVAQFVPDWGAAEIARGVLAPFRRSRVAPARTDAAVRPPS